MQKLRSSFKDDADQRQYVMKRIIQPQVLNPGDGKTAKKEENIYLIIECKGLTTKRRLFIHTTDNKKYIGFVCEEDRGKNFNVERDCIFLTKMENNEFLLSWCKNHQVKFQVFKEK